jgi:hypothetical protein
MFAKISRHVRVYVNTTQLTFLNKYQGQWPMLQTKFDIEDVQTVKTLADKGILVRKKIDLDTLYNLNRYVKFENEKKPRIN